MLSETFLFPDQFFVEPGSKNHLLEDYLPGPGSVSLIIAKPGVGKTTLIADFVFTYAYKRRYEDLGTVPVIDPHTQLPHELPLIEYGSFLGRRITQPPRPVLYLALEGHRQLQLLGAAYTKEQSVFLHYTEDGKRKRLRGKQRLRITDPEAFAPIVFLKEGNAPKLDIDADYKELLSRIEGLTNHFKTHQHSAPGIIVIDTGSRVLDGEENSNTLINKIMARCGDIARACSASVLVLHHTSRSANTPRGGSAWEGAADCVWLLSGEAKKGVTLSVEKLKGFVLPEDLYFKIVPVETEFLDKDHTDGRRLFSARIEQLTEKPPRSPKSSPAADNPDLAAANKSAQAMKTRTKETRHNERQHQRGAIMYGAWAASGEETVDGVPYVTRAALSEYLIKEIGYSPATVQQALKPAADSATRSSVIGPLLAEDLLAKHEHGWLILAASP